MLGAWLVALAVAAPPTVADWTAAFGAPTRGAAESERTRSPDEPVLVYWIQVAAAPLGVGPALPGTLVANFAPGPGSLQDFTFLAVASADQLAALESAVTDAGWVRSVRREVRPAGPFRDLDLALPDGGTGTLSIREGGGGGRLADGRPEPSLWMHVAR